MPISDAFNSPSNRRNPSTSGGISSVLRQQNTGEQPVDLTGRINNAATRLAGSGYELPPPQVEGGGKGLFTRILEGLNYLNNKKNQFLLWQTEGGDWGDVPDYVSGGDLMNAWGMKEEGWGDNIAGFGFDVLTDPLNFLSFGTAGVASKGVQGAARAGEKLLGAGANAATKAPVVAKLGGHIPFTNIGGYVDVPGSGAVLGTLGSGIKKSASGIGRIVEQNVPGLAQAGRGLKDAAGQIFKKGYGVPGEVNQITQQAQDLVRMDAQDIVNQIVGYQKSWMDAGYVPKTDDINIIKALENPSKLSELSQVQQGVAEQVRNFFDFHFLKAKEAGVLDDFMTNYIPHIFKGPKKEVEDALEQMRRRGARTPTGVGFSQERTINQSLGEILDDPDLVKKLQPETNLARLMAVYKGTLEKSIRNQDMLDEMIALGPDVIVRGSDDVYDAATNMWTKVDNEIPKGWVKAPIQQLKGYWVPPEIARHLKNTMEPFINNVEFNKFLKMYDGILGWWKGMATVPNLGFHVRNGLGNVFNNYLAGVRSVDNYAMALQAQKAPDMVLDDFYDLSRYFNPRGEMFGEGVSVPALFGDDAAAFANAGLPAPGGNYREEMMDLVFNSNRFKARFFEGDGPKIPVKWGNETKDVNMTAIKFLAKFYGVTGKGYFGADIGEDIMKQLTPRTLGQKVNILSTKSTPFKAMESVGTMIDDNTRLAHFISKLKSGNSLEEAARSTKKYLFDYTNLSATEKNFFKRVMPFYAFTRNNLPLQIMELIKQPKYATMLGKFQNFTSELAADETGTELDRNSLPSYLRNLYTIRLPFQVGSEDRDLVAGIDLPIRDLNSMTFKEGMSMLTPLLSVPFEQFANRNFYSKRDLEAYEGQTVRAPGYLQGIFRGLTSLSDDDPRVTGFGQMMENFGLTVAPDQNNGGYELRIPTRVAHIFNQIVTAKNIGKLADTVTGTGYDPFASSSFLTGVGVVSSTAQQRNVTSQYQQLQALEDLLRKLSDEGRPVPTLRELQQGGGRGGGILGGR